MIRILNFCFAFSWIPFIFDTNTMFPKITIRNFSQTRIFFYFAAKFSQPSKQNSFLFLPYSFHLIFKSNLYQRISIAFFLLKRTKSCFLVLLSCCLHLTKQVQIKIYCIVVVDNREWEWMHIAVSSTQQLIEKRCDFTITKKVVNYHANCFKLPQINSISPNQSEMKKKKMPKPTSAVKTAHRIRLNIYLFSYLLIIQATPESLGTLFRNMNGEKIEYVFQG